ncbi:MAG: hypothetical protein RL199_362 [Pseudomonadota bacterium]
MTTSPIVSSMDLRAVDDVFDMGSGHVLDFSNRTFVAFFADLGIDIDQEFPEGSKANRLRAFLRGADASRVSRVLEALLEHRGLREEDNASVNLAKVKGLIARLRKTQVSMLPVTRAPDILSFEYVQELEAKVDQRFAAADLDGAITAARTMLEAVLVELERQLAGAIGDYKGDLPRQFKAVAKQLRIDDERADLDDHFKQVARGLVQVVNGLAPIRNKMSDGHARERKPEEHHARVIVNAAKTVATFLVESFRAQRERGLLGVWGDGALTAVERASRGRP